MPAELWDREQIREFLGMRSVNSVSPWLSRNQVRPVDHGPPEQGRVRYLYDADTIRRIKQSLPGKGNRMPRSTSGA